MRYRTYVEGLGWQNWVKDGEISGTTGELKETYAIQIVIEDNEKEFIQTQAEYSLNGNYQTKLIDEVGNATQYQYNEDTGLVTKTIDAKNNETNYTYDTSNRLLNVKKQASQKEYSNTYTYENDMLKTITHNGFTYTFNYDNFGNVKQVKVGNQVLSTNNYEENNGNLLSATYGNNQTISYTYDRFNRITKIAGTNGNYEYTYNANSNVKSIIDGINNNTETFTYDLAERLVKSINTNGFTKEYGYDINNNVNTKKYTLSSKVNSLQYDYDKANRLTSLKLNDSITWTNIMDRLSRLSANKITSGNNTYTTNYTYTDVTNVTNKTTTLLKSIKNGNNDETSYTYDALGNIETIKKGNTLTNKYYYDELNQLIREDNVEQNKTITYEYDAGGNILSKKEYSYTTSSTLPATPNKTITYTIYYTYDENGNVIGLKYNDTQYYYIRNGQNDIVGILDSNLNQVVKYEYDSWGNILSIKDSSGNNITSSTNIGIINPYRYRSYRYDTETGLYYLQSRYYNSEWGRFINFDNYGGQVGELLSHNGYIYCCNNPVNMIDEDGNFPILITAILAVVVTAVSIATVPQDTWTNIGNSITETATTIGDRISSVVSNISTKKKTNTKTKTQTQTVTKTTTKTKGREEYSYKEAELIGGNVVVGKPISYKEAVYRVTIGKNVMCSSQAEALNIAALYNIRKLEEPHGESGYYWHYHINGKHGEPHIWFYGEPYINE